MDVIRLLDISFLLVVSCASPTFAEEERLYLSTTNTEWKTSCAGSGPFVMTGVNLSTFNIDGDVSFMLEGQKTWVGYYRRAQFFSLEGCSRIPSTTKKVWMKEISPGHCLSVCKEYNYIGLEDNVCNCISDDNIKQMSLESYACPYTQCHGGILCGNTTESWIYGTRREDFASSSPQPSIDRAKCITLEKFDHAEWLATNCDEESTPKRVVCLHNDTAVDFHAFNNTRRFAWISAVTLCKDKSEKIADMDLGQYRNIMLKDSRISRFSAAWTSIIVDTVVGKRGSEKNETNPIACGAVLRTNQSANLVFLDCTTSLPAVCVNGISTDKMSTTSIRSETNTQVMNTSSQYAILTDLSTGTTGISITTTEMAKTKTAFPVAGRIGLGILAILVIVGVALVILKMTDIRKRRPSTQTSEHSFDTKTEVTKGIPMLGVNEKEVSKNDDENEIKLKGTSNGCSKDGNAASDPNYEFIQVESSIKHNNASVGNSTGQRDNAHSTNCQYATVVKVGKSSPKITKTTPESDTNTYDTTYVLQEKNRDTGDEYQHIYDHANSKNPTS